MGVLVCQFLYVVTSVQLSAKNFVSFAEAVKFISEIVILDTKDG